MGATENNGFEEHRTTYAAFLKITKWGTISVVLILILMRIFLVH